MMYFIELQNLAMLEQKMLQTCMTSCRHGKSWDFRLIKTDGINFVGWNENNVPFVVPLPAQPTCMRSISNQHKVRHVHNYIDFARRTFSCMDTVKSP